MSDAVASEPDNLSDSIVRDPAVFAEVYELLKAHSSSDLQLESRNQSSALDKLFAALPKPAKSVVLESSTASRKPTFQLDVAIKTKKLDLRDPIRLEAIVKQVGRPALPVSQNTGPSRLWLP